MVYQHHPDMCKLNLKKDNLVLIVFPHQSPELYPIPHLREHFKEKIK